MSIRILVGDVRDKLAELPDESVHTVVTSPPYFGLRDYGTASWEGGDPACDHVGLTSRTGPPGSAKQISNAGTASVRFGDCACGAIRADKQIGLEPTPDAFVAVMVEVFREVRRVLRKDGTLWLNLGDSYNNFRVSKGPGQAIHGRDKLNGKPAPDSGPRGWSGLKEKDLVGIPWRVAFALQADGWYLRQDIIWSKPNPMPESVSDRCTKAHEYLFLLSKSPRYHYDAEAIREEAEYGRRSNFRGGGHYLNQGQAPDNSGKTGVSSTTSGADPAAGRNKRSVWEVSTAPYSEAHFATFPPDLIEPCILAGCPKGGTVLDPFGGAGTTGLVADRLQRDAILIELNPAYATLATNRITDDGPLFAEVVA